MKDFVPFRDRPDCYVNLSFLTPKVSQKSQKNLGILKSQKSRTLFFERNLSICGEYSTTIKAAMDGRQL